MRLVSVSLAIIFFVACSFAGVNIKLDSASIADRFHRVKKLKQNAQRITRNIDQSVVQSLVSDPKPVAKAEPKPVLVPPEVLFDKPRKVVSYSYSNDGRYVTKKDLNSLVDSLTSEFRVSLKIVNQELDQLQEVANIVLDQNEKQNQKQNDLYAWFTGGGLTALITALTGFFLLFKRRKNAAADSGRQTKQTIDEIVRATLRAEREARKSNP